MAVWSLWIGLYRNPSSPRLGRTNCLSLMMNVRLTGQSISRLRYNIWGCLCYQNSPSLKQLSHPDHPLKRLTWSEGTSLQFITVLFNLYTWSHSGSLQGPLWIYPHPLLRKRSLKQLYFPARKACKMGTAHHLCLNHPEWIRRINFPNHHSSSTNAHLNQLAWCNLQEINSPRVSQPTLTPWI